MKARTKVIVLSALLLAGVASIAAASFVDNASSMTIHDSLCVGLDCANAETFNADTVILKENNLRVLFDDTSASGSFPFHDWRLTANDQANGGANRFSIDDVTSGTSPLNIQGDAPTNALYVAADGHVGMGTNTTALRLNLQQADTPGMRLAQDGSGGFSAYTWDVAGNEANFFIRDVNAGSHLPFRIYPGAPTNTLVLAGSGKVGIGTNSPSGLLHVTSGASTGTDPFAGGAIRVQLTPGSPATSIGLTVTNNGAIANAFADSSSGQLWYETYAATQPNGEGTFQIAEASSPSPALTLAANGDLRIGGVLSEGSSRSIKHNFSPVDPDHVLDRVAALPIQRWQYKVDPSQATHLGPMAEDFHAAFGVGDDDKHLSAIDASGVALAAIQALHRENQALRSENTEMKARLAHLEALVERIASAPHAR